MNALSTQVDPTIVPSEDYREQILEMARSLDRMGRRTEQFLLQQLQQIEIAIEDLEREKSAWRRQQQRETAQLQTQRDELARLRRHNGMARGIPEPIPVAQVTEADSDGPQPVLDRAQQPPEQAAAESGAGPIRILLRPGTASAAQIGLLLLEFTRLNRETGGAGVRFEIAESRLLRSKWFGKFAPGVVLELDGFSCLPLTAATSQGAFEVDTSENLDSWMTFKAYVVQSSLTDPELETSFREAHVAPRHLESRALILEATARAADAAAASTEHRYTRPAFRVSRGVDAVRRQLARLEHCVECLVSECGLRIDVKLR